jgi:hypothetical protein
VLSALRFMDNISEPDIIEAMKVLQRGQCWKINSPSFSPPDDDSRDVQVMEESQGSLFKNSRTGTR